MYIFFWLNKIVLLLIVLLFIFLGYFSNYLLAALRFGDYLEECHAHVQAVHGGAQFAEVQHPPHPAGHSALGGVKHQGDDAPHPHQRPLHRKPLVLSKGPHKY